MPFCPMEGWSLHYEVDGKADAPALILSNSLAADVSMWDAQVRHWAKRFRVVRYDQRGHGSSGAPLGDYSIDALGLDVVALMDHLGIDRADWCGISMGGMTGLWLAAHAPERMRRLVVANTAAQMPPRELWDERIANARALGMEALASPTVERWFPAEFRAREPGTVARIRRVVAATPVDGYAGCCAAIRDLDLRGDLGPIRHPVLVIVGDRDASTPPAAGEFIRSNIPGARLARLDAAHLSSVERPEEFADLVENFLRSD
ncbi:3-oxoadipate enol-lactonase [Skermanella stibiiresistens SB22]|uniref:3-oxoadipate enol-lactonase n=1 Tax=Skermanella stibiiresistens SB22 TaxID=1385369 RepID=W9H6S0_9PROT|nr:3-oxoadipate enol-lactonase [Skermanella stibiiresistens]EWY41719.1 3-oxoadipate enol-lactonase [Skermanella stibiiresistens SB22]